MSRNNSSMSLLACLLATMIFTPMNAKPIGARERAWDEGNADSLRHLVVESSWFMKELLAGLENRSHMPRSDERPSRVSEKGAIIGGTIASGIILGVTVFVGVAIYKQYQIRRKLLAGYDKATENQRKNRELEATPDTSTRQSSAPDALAHESWRQTFNHPVSIPCSESVYSERSFGNISTAAQVEIVSPSQRPTIATTVPPKAASMLGVDQQSHMEHAAPSTPRQPANDSRASRQSQKIQPPPVFDPPPRATSNCTMSTLGMELLRDTMQPPAPAKFKTGPSLAGLPKPPPPAKNKHPPLAMNNLKGQSRMPSRRYFVPVFKQNGQLQSPTSPEENSGMETKAQLGRIRVSEELATIPMSSVLILFLFCWARLLVMLGLEPDHDLSEGGGARFEARSANYKDTVDDKIWRHRSSVKKEEIEDHEDWDTLRDDPNWYDNIVLSAFNRFCAKRRQERKGSLVEALGKAEIQERRNEKFARKNPERIQKQIDDLKKVTTSGGKLTGHEEQTLEGLEKELRAVKKARETLGDKAPAFGRGWNRDRDSGPGVLGKRRRGSNDATTSDEEVTDDVKAIPMPRDTPPPIPKDVLDKWYADRRAKRAAENPNLTRPIGEDKIPKRDAPVVESKTVYEAKPIVRDLRKEAVAAFVPTAVKMKLNKGQGQGGLMEPEEADRLEKEGYLKKGDDDARRHDGQGQSSRHVTMEEVDDEEA
ncbi:hypothetical protein FZEAL_9407 [Fusarium zealandicum]|uniref:Wbp11/ELF5/Saf1 N-terminal domain-containing protein n=1 Tax=Fusarium zealandicum TaxID=1053134 RepID=A0A8H4UBM2_9HYPO|nr:hypothetical protein FZEAL_9407 [Fusarium zealandicum]